jgi:four helix bundle protein
MHPAARSRTPPALPLHTPARAAQQVDGSGRLGLLPAVRLCLLARAASRPQPALRAGACLLARAGSLDPARDSLACQGAGVRGARREREVAMLRIYGVVLEVLAQLQPVLKRIEVKDRDLARQLRRCSSSVALNLAEGMYSRGQNRNARYHTALGSARETLACLEVAVVCNYVPKNAQLQDQLDRVVGTLVKLTRV